MASTQSGMDARLTGAETEIGTLKSLIGELAKSTSAGFDRVERQIGDLAKTQAQSGRTNWSPILATIAVLVSLFGMGGGAAFTILTISGRAMVDPISIQVGYNNAMLSELRSDMKASIASIAHNTGEWRASESRWLDVLRRLDAYDATRKDWPVDIARLDERVKTLERFNENQFQGMTQK